MPPMMQPLARLEKQIGTLLESSLSRLLGVEISPTEVAAQVARAMYDSVKRGVDGETYAPDQYALTLHPDDVEALMKQAPNLHHELSSGLLEASRASGYAMAREPHIMLASDPTLTKWEVRVVVWHSSNPLEFTQAMPRQQKTQPGKLPVGAFFIVDGGRHFPLDRPVINIGRRLDNQLILEDPHVSRTHAQLRVKDSRYVLFDLGSTAGTQVNGRAIRQHTLRPGDVVRIADVRLVYGEDTEGTLDATPAYSPPFPPRPAGDQRTYTIDKAKREEEEEEE